LVLLEPTLDDLRRQCPLALERTARWRALTRRPLLATALDPALPARADAVEVIAARLGTVTIEVHADQAVVPAATAAGAHVGERREVGLLDGRGRHGRVYHGAGDDEERAPSTPSTSAHRRCP
jgi:hypothetical protein